LKATYRVEEFLPLRFLTMSPAKVGELAQAADTIARLGGAANQSETD